MRCIAVLFACVFATLNCKNLGKETCREYATQVLASNGVFTSCGYDADANKLYCSRTGSSAESIYASKKDFVDEGQVVGKILALTFTVTGTGAAHTNYFYSSDRRILSWVTTSAAAVSIQTPSAWDHEGRPTFTTRNLDAGSGNTCNGSTESLSFDDGARAYTSVVSHDASTGTGTLSGTPCATMVNSTISYRYDQNRNLISAGSLNYRILATGMACYH